jgi:hypothetical protein
MFFAKELQFGLSMHFNFQHKFHPNKKVMVDEMYTFIFYTNFIQQVTIGGIKKTPTE